MPKTILVVDDEKDIRSSLAGILEDEGFIVSCAAGGVEALESVHQDMPDIVLLDIWMPGLDGLETLEKLKALFPNLAVIMVSGHGTIETAVRATKLGAFDFIEKPLSLDKVLITVNNALRMVELWEENEELKRVTAIEYELIGDSPALVGLRERIMRAASTAAPVLMTGENGTGKELIARTIHHKSSRRQRPFVAVNCAAIPEELIERELFGHERDASNNAQSPTKKGVVDAADGGTLFLDEIGDMPLETQGKILSLLQENCFQRFGDKRQVPVDIRVVAASSREIEDDIRSGRFRVDLFSLLNATPFRVPPLRERREDIPPLVQHLVSQFNHREGREPRVFLPEAIDLLAQFDWPGNVRELKNIVERILIMVSDRVITAEAVSRLFGNHKPESVVEDARTAQVESGTLRQAREGFEKAFIMQKLNENGGNISRTAEQIEVERVHLHRKIRNYGINMKR